MRTVSIMLLIALALMVLCGCNRSYNEARAICLAHGFSDAVRASTGSPWYCERLVHGTTELVLLESLEE